MDREKQIEEMAKITCSMYCRDKEKKCADVQECDMKCLHHQRCEALYNAGYRKQNIGEWIMVREGITERVVCSNCNSEAKILSNEEAEEAQEFFDSQLQKIDDVVDPKFRVVCSLLHQPEERILKSCVFGFVLEYLRLWYKEAIEWNSITEGPVSNIPDDFKDIYLKVYDSGGNLILSDEYTLESKGLKKTGWTRISENTPKT